MLNHVILTTIVGLLGAGLHLWLRHSAKRGEPQSLEIERWEGDDSSSSARFN